MFNHVVMIDKNETLSGPELPPSTAPGTIPFNMRAFASTDEAERVAGKIGAYVRLLSRAMDLSRLDGVTIAYDYDAALAELDRGLTDVRPLSRSNDDQLIGVGMAPAVLRDGVVKVHIIINAAYLEGLSKDVEASEASEEFASSLYLLAHECAHVAVTTETDRLLPGTVLQHRIASYEEAIFQQVNEACWEEYAACRLSARFGQGQSRHYEDGLRGVLSVSRQKAAAARERFWEHKDLNRVVGELGQPLAEPLRLAAYALGHIDGLEEPAELGEQTRHAIREAGYEELLETLAKVLRRLWINRNQRTKLSDHDIIGDVARDAFWAGGLLIQAGKDDGARVDVWEPDEVNPLDLGLTQSWRKPKV